MANEVNESFLNANSMHFGNGHNIDIKIVYGSNNQGRISLK